MNVEIFSDPYRVTLLGFRGPLEAGSAHASAKPLMDKMWKEVRDHRITNTGTNYWVYLPDSTIFTGIELKEPTTSVGNLEALDVSLDRYVRHLHVGSYSTLGAKWQYLMAALKQLGEKPCYPNLEIYGHWNADETKCETTILICLAT